MARRIDPLERQTINEALRLLGQILERAVESEHYVVERNPVKGRSGLRVTKPGGLARRHLEADEVLSLIEAADTGRSRSDATKSARADRARALRSPWIDLVTGRRGARAAPTVDRDLPVSGEAQTRRAKKTARNDHRPRAHWVSASELTACLGASGPHSRPSWSSRFKDRGGDPRDLPLARSYAKSSRSTRRRCPMSQCRAIWYSPFAGRDGDRFNLGRRLKHLAAVGTRSRAAKDSCRCRAITPHTFRRTFITLCFQAGKDLPYVQSQVWAPDWQTTLEIYTQQTGRSIDPRFEACSSSSSGNPSNTQPAAKSTAKPSSSPVRLLPPCQPPCSPSGTRLIDGQPTTSRR